MRYLDYGVQKMTNDAIKFSYHFLLSDAQPDFSGTFHQDFSCILAPQNLNPKTLKLFFLAQPAVEHLTVW